MGYGSYSHDAHLAMTSSRSSKSQQEVFSQRGCHPLMDPKGLVFRESRDSEAHPESLAVIFALDVSASMGHIPARLATHTLPHFMRALLDVGVASPQVMFMAIGCARGDSAPLQVGQFESTESLMDQWLTSMYIESRGGGGNESYELAMYTAARHVKADCIRKRAHRGYLFITGDEPPNPAVSRQHVAQLIGTHLPDDIPITDMIDELQRDWEPFFVIPDPQRAQRVERAWRDLFGDRVIVLDDADDTAHVCAGLVALIEGDLPDLNAVMKELTDTGLAADRVGPVAGALQGFARSIGKLGVSADVGSSDLPDGTRTSGVKRS